MNEEYELQQYNLLSETSLPVLEMTEKNIQLSLSTWKQRLIEKKCR